MYVYIKYYLSTLKIKQGSVLFKKNKYNLDMTKFKLVNYKAVFDMAVAFVSLKLQKKENKNFRKIS